MRLGQNIYFDGGVYERLACRVQRTVMLDRQPTGHFGNLEFLPSLRWPPVPKIVHGLLWPVYGFCHSSPDPHEDGCFPEYDLRKIISALAHFPPPTFGFRRNILGQFTGPAIKKDKRDASVFCDPLAPPSFQNAYGELRKRQEPESGSLSGPLRRTWLKLAADLRRPRNSLAVAIGYDSFSDARRVTTIVFTHHACSPIIIPATVVATLPAAVRARTVISANDDGVRVGSRWDGDDGRKSESDSKNDFLHGVLPRVIRPRVNDCLALAFHKKSRFRLQSEETSDHRRICGGSE